MKTKQINKPTWNLKLLYDSEKDPRIEKDVRKSEELADTFNKKYAGKDVSYFENAGNLKKALSDYEKMMESADAKPILYFNYRRDLDSQDETATAQLALLENRLTKAHNQIIFFKIVLGSITPEKQKILLENKSLSHFKVFLGRIFETAKHRLSIQEEKIINLKSLPAYDMWVDGNEKILNSHQVMWNKKAIPLARALNILRDLPTSSARKGLSAAIAVVLKNVAPFSEAEINAVVTNHKINDELRKHKTPYEHTVKGYQNDPMVVENLVDTVTDNFKIAHRFFKIKARLLKQKKLSYSDRAAKIGTVSKKFSFGDSVLTFKGILDNLDPRYSPIFDKYLRQGQIDAFPRAGKKSGAYCWGSYSNPTFVLLNHTDTLYSFNTLAHEMGHAFHTELSKPQGPIYCHYSTSLAETASTLFETLAFETLSAKVSDREKIIMLHDKISDDIATVFRQIACFNFEKEIHAIIRNKGFISHTELADLHNKHMSSYLGPQFKLTRDDGYFFVHWSHIRRFFYVYSYAYGQLVSKALLRRYKQDPSFWKKIEQFLSSGGNDSPENILHKIGIDPSKPDFWREGLRGIEEDIKELEKLGGKKSLAF